MTTCSLQEIGGAIAGLQPKELAELRAWFDRHYPKIQDERSPAEEGLGLLGSPEDAALLDEVVRMVYEDRRMRAAVA